MFVLSLVSTFVVVVAPPSWAVSNCNEESRNGYDSIDTNARGTANSIYIRDRILAANCYPDIFDSPGAWSTAHLQGNGSTTRFAEAGYWEGWGCSGTCHVFRFFWEGQVGNTVYGGFDDGPGGESSGMTDRFKVSNVQGTTQWVFYYQIGSGSFQKFGPNNSCQCLDLGFSQGTPNGETSRAGDPETGANDHQSELKYHKNDFSGWSYWQTDRGQSCNGNPCIPGYHYTYVSYHDYRIDPN